MNNKNPPYKKEARPILMVPSLFFYVVEVASPYVTPIMPYEASFAKARDFRFDPLTTDGPTVR